MNLRWHDMCPLCEQDDLRKILSESLTALMRKIDVLARSAAADQFRSALDSAHDLGFHVAIHRTPSGSLAIELRKVNQKTKRPTSP